MASEDLAAGAEELIAEVEALDAREAETERCDYEARRRIAARAFALLDRIAAERGIARQGEAWKIIERCRRIRLGEERGPYRSVISTIKAVADPDERRMLYECMTCLGGLNPPGTLPLCLHLTRSARPCQRGPVANATVSGSVAFV